MNFGKIEAALNALGWNGEVGDISINVENGICKVGFTITKNTVKEDIPKVVPEKEEPKYEAIEDYIKRTEAEKQEKDIPEKTKKEKSDYVPSPTRRYWKTPVPRTVIRYVYFKDRKSADEFEKKYINEFELIEDDVKKDKAVRCELAPAGKNDPMYYEGYPWRLSFRMNGADFEVLENCEGLKKRKNAHPGGACIRYKEVV